MFCSQCGTQLENTARFCFNCGSPVSSGAQTSNTYQPPVGRQPAANGASNYTEKQQEHFGVNIVYPDGRYNEIGDLYITDTEMIFVKKSKGVRIAFGFLGTAMQQGEEKLRFNLADIISGGRTRIGLNSNVYQITLRNGDTYKLCVNNPAKLSYLERMFG